MKERFLPAPLDRAARVRTAATLAGLGSLLILIALIRQIAFGATLLAVPVVAVGGLAYAVTTLGYQLDERALRIERKALWPVTVPLAQISACRPLPRTSLDRAIRVYGTGGFFGWAGRYRIRGLGAVAMHATNLDRLILVERRRRRPILISPADPNAFLRGLRRQYETIVVPPGRSADY